MTHPLRDPKTNGPRRRAKQGEPFDPEELSRRLQAHLVEQKIKAEKRREARAAKAAAAGAVAAQHVYHHVPKVAAAAFERTTTPEAFRKVHKLAQPAMRAHLEVLSLEDSLPNQPVTSLQKTVAMDQAMLERDLLRNRNQFQWTHDMEDAAEADMERDLYKPPQRTFYAEFAHLKGSRKQGVPRPLSTGDMFWEEEGSPPPQKPKVKPAPHDIVNDHRNDWVQRDDGLENRKKDKTSPFLRKMESSWILMGKKEKGLKQERRDEGIAGFGSSSPDNGKGAKGSFLTRFKRHPS